MLGLGSSVGFALDIGNKPPIGVVCDRVIPVGGLVMVAVPTPKSAAALRGASMMGFMVGIEGDLAGVNGECPLSTCRDRFDEETAESAADDGVSGSVLPVSVTDVRKRGKDAVRYWSAHTMSRMKDIHCTNPPGFPVHSHQG